MTLAMSLFLVLLPSPARADDTPAPGQPPTHAHVISVYDGDTFTLDTGDRVRLRAVNTPELKPYENFATEARDATETFVSGKEITLRYGKTIRDSYGRLIADAVVDGKDLSLYLTERGLAHVFIVAPADQDLTALLAAQARARASGFGIWTDERYKGALHITSFHANGRGDERENVNAEYLRICNVTDTPLNLSAYHLTDISGQSWALPDVVVPAGFTFELHSGKGDNQADPGAPLMVYLGSDTPIWNNDRDRASLLDEDGHVVDARAYEPKAHNN